MLTIEEDIYDIACKKLWAHVLKQTIKDLPKNTLINVYSSIIYFNSPSILPGSFIWICTLLDMTPYKRRKSILTTGKLY